VSGTSTDGSPVTDNSTPGSDPDGDDEDNDPDEMGTTSTPLTEDASAGIAKREVSVNLGTDGCTEVVYEFNIENFGNVNLDSIQIEDDLAGAGFSDCGGGFTTTITSDDFTVNADYNGNGDNNLLTGLDDIEPGDVGSILLTIEACGCPNNTVINNSADLSGVSPSGQDVTDESVSGSDPDGMDNDGNPDESNVTQTTLTETGSIGIAKRVVSTALDADGCTEVVYEFNIENFGNVNLDSIQVEDDLASAGFSNCGSFTTTLISDEFTVNTAFDGKQLYLQQRHREFHLQIIV